MGEVIAFYILALIIVLGALAVVTGRNLFHCGLSLAAVLLAVAGLFILNGAEFLAWVQVLIYVGAVLVIILYAIMLSENITGERILLISQNRGVGFAAATLVFALIAFLGISLSGLLAGHTSSVKDPVLALLEGADSNVIVFGTLLLTRYILPFEFASVFLVIALIGALVIARTAE
ncbi:MAG: NADH-quinone oxidoreductase subunit J [Armatimonadetes bacterium]|nr:NADH-quinone oxidoreductase subunit J [Armatimonadota bacterium]MDW8121969.1 NADH-quinone oxidoreductase subunit J [Armatimonadota bacterium]